MAEKQIHEVYAKRRNELVKDAQTKKFSLTAGDRRLLKVFLGYTNGFGIKHNKLKGYDNACLYVRETLLDASVEDENSENSEKEAGENKENARSPIPLVFEKYGKKWMSIGKSFTANEEVTDKKKF